MIEDDDDDNSEQPCCCYYTFVDVRICCPLFLLKPQKIKRRRRRNGTSSCCVDATHWTNWTVRTLYLNCTWTVLELHLNCTWTIHGLYAVFFVQFMYSSCTVHFEAYIIFKKCSPFFWKRWRTHLLMIWKICLYISNFSKQCCRTH